MISNVDYAIQRGEKMEVTEITKIRRKVLTMLAKMTYDGNLPDHVYDVLQIVNENTPRLRCCVHKERAVLKERINVALGMDTDMNIIQASQKALEEPVDRTQHVIAVLPEACSACPVNKYMITDICRRCLTHRCMNGCPKKAISVYQGRAHIDYDMCVECGNCKRACPYGAVAEIARPCENACKVHALHTGKNKKAEIDKNICVECGACRAACPFGAIEERSHIVQLIQAIKSGQKIYCLLAPSFVGQFGLKVQPGQIVAACKKLGFKEVREVAVGADMTTISEAGEYVEKVEHGTQKLMTSSCCPAFVATVKRHAPALADCISDTVSPMVARSKAVKHDDPGALTVFVGPCIAKKVEAREHPEDIDFVLTFEELKCMMDSMGINPADCEAAPFHAASSADGCSFPQAAGVSTAVNDYTKEKYNLEVSGQYCNGLDQCLQALKDYQDGKLDVKYIEGMACEKGCLNGPGAMTEPGITRVLLKRFAATTAMTCAGDNELAQQGVKNVDMERVYLRK